MTNSADLLRQLVSDDSNQATTDLAYQALLAEGASPAEALQRLQRAVNADEDLRACGMQILPCRCCARPLFDPRVRDDRLAICSACLDQDQSPPASPGDAALAEQQADAARERSLADRRADGRRVLGQDPAPYLQEAERWANVRDELGNLRARRQMAQGQDTQITLRFYGCSAPGRSWWVAASSMDEAAELAKAGPAPWTGTLNGVVRESVPDAPYYGAAGWVYPVSSAVFAAEGRWVFPDGTPLSADDLRRREAQTRTRRA